MNHLRFDRTQDSSHQRRKKQSCFFPSRQQVIAKQHAVDIASDRGHNDLSPVSVVGRRAEHYGRSMLRLDSSENRKLTSTMSPRL